MSEKLDIVQVVSAASQVPGVRIKRDDFLRSEFGAPKYSHLKQEILKKGPVAAGISKADVAAHAKAVIDFEAAKATTLSAAAGLPGGAAVIAAVPADLAQFYAHVLRVIQKLMYLYGWEDFGGMDEGTKNILFICLGIMSGVHAAENAMTKLCASTAAKMSKTIAAKALTKTTLYPVVKQICTQLGVRMTKEVFAKSVSKLVPVLGAVASGALTLATFKPMCNKLLNSLSKQV